MSGSEEGFDYFVADASAASGNRDALGLRHGARIVTTKGRIATRVNDELPRDWRPAILSALAALAIYAVTLAGTYVYDDRYIVQLDPRVSDVAKWREYWTKDYFNGGADNLYRPLVSMSYAIQAKLLGNDERHAWTFHLVNWLLHAAVAAAVAELGRRITRSSAVGAIAGLLFAVHPIHVEAVANIVGRAELMCALGMMGALVLYLRPLTITRAICIWLCFVFALLSKEQGLLLLLLLLAAIPLRQSAEPRVERTGKLTLVLLLLWSLAGYMIFRERILKFWWDRSFLDSMINPMLLAHGADRWLMPIDLLGHYVALLIAPVHLSPDYGGGVIGWHVRLADPYVYLGIVTILAGLTGSAIAIMRRGWSVLFCLISIALLYGMISNLITLIGINFAERLMYIPSAFVCILGGIAFARFPRGWMASVVAIAVVLFSLRSVTYAWEWNDRLRYYRYSTEHSPEAVQVQILLAEEYAERGNLDEAMRAIARVRALQPTYFRAWIRSATIAMQAGQWDDALQFARRAHQLQPTSATMSLINEILQRQAPATAPMTTAPRQPSR